MTLYDPRISGQLDPGVHTRGWGVVREPAPTLPVRFEKRAVEKRAESAGKVKYRDAIFAIVTKPGGGTFEKEMRNEAAFDWLKKTHPAYVDIYLKFIDTGENEIVGTPITMWPAITPATARNLQVVGIESVEQLADASDAQLQNIGMGGRDLKAKAEAFCKMADDSDHTLRLAKENEDMKDKMLRLEETIEALREETSALKAKKDDSAVIADEVFKPKAKSKAKGK